MAAALAPYTGRAQVIGLTGSPGVGKSTTTNELVRALRAQGHRVGVLAVDPSSPFTGGAILGDRVRMQDHATDPGVYIRSMSSRGHLGGLAAATPQAVRVLEGAGCDVVLVETVGVGQAEVEVASLADTTLVLLAPGHGRRDPGGQGRHPGDRRRVRGQQGRPRRRRRHLPRHPGHDRRSASAGRATGGRRSCGRSPREAEGIDDIVAAIDKHRAWLVEHGELRRRREARAAAEVEAIALGSAARPDRLAARRYDAAADAGRARVGRPGDAADPYAAADDGCCASLERHS